MGTPPLVGLGIEPVGPAPRLGYWNMTQHRETILLRLQDGMSKYKNHLQCMRALSLCCTLQKALKGSQVIWSARRSSEHKPSDALQICPEGHAVLFTSACAAAK